MGRVPVALLLSGWPPESLCLKGSGDGKDMGIVSGQPKVL